jgi:hypothetical protein
MAENLTAGSADETKNPDAKTVSRAPAAKWKKMRLLRGWKCGRRVGRIGKSKMEIRNWEENPPRMGASRRARLQKPRMHIRHAVHWAHRLRKAIDFCRLVGHIMTTMRTPLPPPIPHPNDSKSIEAHRLYMLVEFGQLFDLIDRALRESVPKAKDIFSLLDGPVDLSVHAGLTRYLCRRFLASQNVPSEEEDGFDFDVEKIANCGLCLNQGQTQLRILKATAGGIPKASSEARSRFYSSNQFLLRFDQQGQNGTAPQTPLSLVVLWTLSEGFSYGGIEIACPRGERSDRSVDCYWITNWQGNQASSGSRRSDPLAPDLDLDEIRPIQKRKKASS